MNITDNIFLKITKVKCIIYDHWNESIMKDHENKTTSSYSKDSSRRNDSHNGLIYFNTKCDQWLENALEKTITFVMPGG